MSDIPCKDCLIFPICKSQITDYIQTHSFAAVKSGLNIYKVILKPKCSIISDWVEDPPAINMYSRYNDILTLFTKYEKLSVIQMIIGD